MGLHDENSTPLTWACPFCAATFDEASRLRGHLLSHSKPSKAVPPSSPPSSRSSAEAVLSDKNDPTALQSDDDSIRDLQRELLEKRLEHRLMETESKISEVSSKMQPQQRDPVDAALERLLKLKQVQLLDAQQSNNVSGQPTLQMLWDAFMKGVEFAKGSAPDGHIDPYVQAMAQQNQMLLQATLGKSDVATLQMYKDLGVVQTPGVGKMDPYAAALEKAKLDASREERKELRAHEVEKMKEATSGRTLERLAGIAEKASEVVVNEVARPFGMALANKTTQWGASPSAPAAASRDQQIAQIDDLVARASAARDALLRQREGGAEQQGSAPRDLIEASIRNAVVNGPPSAGTDSTSGPGQVFTGRK